ncbi:MULTISPECIES: hypothetical protein [Microbacterium]|uniref:hypothetical protein n=1 Tax=Microbacterium TaxID=33882 RepID=UPI0010F77AD4|nr:hypothetical protein [Microbacterium sp. 4NA327F11]MCK9920167.1 hypothetical protein [Microbacteriaceae bacterium K1510]
MSGADDERQRVVRVRGARRARLTAAPGKSGEPAASANDDAAPARSDDGPNDERMRREVPPHY